MQLSTMVDSGRHAISIGRRWLVVIGEGLDGAYPLPDRGRVAIGRSEDADVRIDHPSVSRRHAMLDLDDRLTLTDLGSANGTRIGDHAMPPHAPTALALGEPVDLGKVMVLVQERAVPPPPREVSDLESLVPRIAAGTISVLITGETGVGKEVLAERIHRLSPRAERPFLRLHCAALSESLLESELFGHERGAFTGAIAAKPGLLETAEGGTVFLDEIGELPMTIQVKLLRVIEERKVWRVGALRPQSIDVRFVSATHRDLEAEIARGRFRQDLYFRLDGISLSIAPLRERVAEIAPLARELARRIAGEDAPMPTAAAIARLEAYDWPGNIRELRNVIERALLLSTDGAIGIEHLPQRARPAAPPPSPLPAPARDDERARILDALSRAGGNQTEAAKLLGVSRRTLINRIISHRIPRPRRP